ncbi:SEL1-like repeat protein [Metapseudomonas boanensis]|uniref:SEL1-like repeat protein n=1 Tax=Metapseudomonas boanensis TaxID=2822138 RepID=UPI0032E86624
MAACATDGTYSKKDLSMDRLSQIKADLAFTCRHEHFPDPLADTDTLFKYARWLEKNNQLKQDKTVDAQIERLYRIAAENGHAKANINLQNGSMRNRRYGLTGEENLRLSHQLINTEVATGYYFVGIFLNQGSAGLQEDKEMALRYFRKAADEGSANAQAYVADKLAPIDIAPDIARQMRRCAAEQGNGKAAVALGVNLSVKGCYQEALEAFQLGVAAGISVSASFLYKAFRAPPSSDELHYLAQQEDLERADRYEKIWSILADYSYANPKVPEINEIVPLPPAPLPPWDGKLQWLEERLANVPPPKPSDALIRQLADAKKLDPATGRPLPDSPVFSGYGFPVRTCYSGALCPHTGYWKVMWPLQVEWRDVTRYFEEGETMPAEMVKRVHERPWPFADKVTERLERVQWGMLG